ncbi:nucleoside triphosphate pyrophosphohydrolase family protein [Flavobacterium johnsoniae]|uniref:Uncharacterized protein n=1 Tax=Flavobacterium johnsoniae TaxID=986 RepID=A0A1M5IIQ5_FLAJO|nr:hypothetical protein [Flavobacterium johnsoniae]SHG28116.1 hypothetical protein SAMN05444388_102118 [Flavobacterium johnsoniae]
MEKRMLNTDEEIMLYAVEIWGQRSQIEMAQEEATELALACRKFIRVISDENFQNLGSEIADVEIMISQLKLMFPRLEEISVEQKIKKMHRLKFRLYKHQFEGDET